MDLKDYRVMPDEGLFGKIERRVRLRRRARVGGAALAAAVVVGVAVWLLKPTVVGPRAVASTEVAGVESTLSEATSQMAEVATVTAVGETRTVAVVVQQSVTKEESPAVEESPVDPMPTVAVETVEPVRTVIAPGVRETGTEAAAVSSEEGVQGAELADASSNSDFRAETKEGGSASVTPQHENLLWAPNVIVPSSDDVENRVFKVQATSAVSHFHLIIFNRGGRQIFSTDDIARGWDATMGGSTVPQGTYVWVARYRDSAGNLREEKGTVTVVR